MITKNELIERLYFDVFLECRLCGDNVGIVLNNKKGIWILTQEDYETDGEYKWFIELNDIDEDGGWEPSAEWNCSVSCLANFSELTETVINYLEDNDIELKGEWDGTVDLCKALR